MSLMPAATWSQTLIRLIGQERSVRRRAALWRWAWMVGVAWTGWVLLDAAWPTPGWLRIAAGPLLIGATLAGLGRAWLTPPHSAPRVVRRIEHAAHLTANPLINATQLPGHSAVAQRGQISLSELPLATILRPRRHGDPWMCLAVAFVAGLLTLMAPGLWTTAFWRLAQPWSDHPPYSRFQFAVAVEPQPVKMRQDAVVRVTVSGGQPAELRFVQWDPQGRRVREGIMARDAEGRFVHRLLTLTEPLTFHVETDGGRSGDRSGGRSGGRSRRFTITPEPAVSDPPVQAAAATDWSGSDVDALRGRLRELHQQALAASEDASDDLAVDSSQLLSRLQALASALNDLQSQLPASLQVTLARVGPPPDPPTPASSRLWLSGLIQALEEARGQLGEAAGGGPGHVGSQRGDGGEAPSDATLARGVLSEPDRNPASPQSPWDEQTRVWVEQAPPAYRALVADYFRRLAQPPERP